MTDAPIKRGSVAESLSMPPLERLLGVDTKLWVGRIAWLVGMPTFYCTYWLVTENGNKANNLLPALTLYTLVLITVLLIDVLRQIFRWQASYFNHIVIVFCLSTMIFVATEGTLRITKLVFKPIWLDGDGEYFVLKIVVGPLVSSLEIIGFDVNSNEFQLFSLIFGLTSLIAILLIRYLCRKPPDNNILARSTGSTPNALIVWAISSILPALLLALAKSTDAVK